MDLSAIIKAVLTPWEGQSADQHSALKPGDQLIGRVLRLEADGRTLIDLGRFQVLAKVAFDVQPGQILNLKVIKTTLPMHLKVDTAQINRQEGQTPATVSADIVPGQDSRSAAQIIDALRSGDQMAGQIVQKEGDGRTLIDLNRFLMRLQTDAPLKPGQAVQIKVIESGPTLRVQLFTLDHPTAARLPQLDPVQALGIANAQRFTEVVTRIAAKSENVAAITQQMPQPVQRALTQIQHHLTPLPMSADAAPDQIAKYLRTVVQERSILFEQRLADAVITATSRSGSELETNTRVQQVLVRDLKPQLLMVRAFLLETEQTTHAESRQEDIVFLRQSVDRLLMHLHQQQQQAVQRSGEPDLFQVFTHLIPVQDQANPVRLKVYYPKKEKQGHGDDHHQIALLLDMDQLGPVRADLQVLERRLSVRFFVQDQDVQEIFNHHIKEVERALASFFDHVQTSIRVSGEKIASFDGEDLVALFHGRIDIQA